MNSQGCLLANLSEDKLQYIFKIFKIKYKYMYGHTVHISYVVVGNYDIGYFTDFNIYIYINILIYYSSGCLNNPFMLNLILVVKTSLVKKTRRCLNSGPLFNSSEMCCFW